MCQSLPSGFLLRSPTLDDLPMIADLFNACDIADGDQPGSTTNELFIEFQRRDFVPEVDAWVIISTDDGLIVSYGEVWNRNRHASLSGDSYVHPDYRELGLGVFLLHVMELRAKEHLLLAPPELPVTIRNDVSGVDKLACEQHVNQGYSAVRYFWRMEIQMSEAPPRPDWPPGLTIRNVIPGEDDRPIFDALEDAFVDHLGDSPWDFETWRIRRFETEDFDPTMWFLAMDGVDIAGAAISRYRGEYGWISQLAVRRPWRRGGLGLALLLHSIGEFYRRGMGKVGLTVDAQNPTGATRLYELAGMHMTNEYIVFEKELRPSK
jgi:GNAT superfamily N-acetyltransferase